MKHNKIYSLILAISVLIFSGCNDTKENPPVPDGPYAFINATTPKKITRYASEGTEISVTLVKFDLAAPGQTVQMLPFDSKYGEIVNLTVDTDENGKAIWVYKAPEGSDFTELKGQETIITAIFEQPIEDADPNVVVDPDAAPVIILTQDFLLQFR